MKRVWLSVFGLMFFFPFTALASSKAGLVIQNSTGEVITRCVEFEEEMISVDELLQRSGFQIITEQKSWGTSIKYLHDDGIQAGESHPLGWFWNFYQHDGTDWVMSDIDVSFAEATDGTIFGFVFGPVDETQPPKKTFSDVCEIRSTAGLVIDHSDGIRVVRPVEFYGETITGLQLLQKSGLALTTNVSAFGTAICSIDGEGMPSDNCFGDPQGRFWAFSILSEDDTWQMSSVGAASAIVRNGDVHGYYYSVWGAEQPPVTRSEILGTVEPTSTPIPTEVPVLPTSTPTPTMTPVSTPTPVSPVSPLVTVMDTLLSNTDLSNDMDRDNSQYRSLTIQWDFSQDETVNQEDISDIHIYVSVNGDEFTYLGRTADGSVTHYEWRQGASNVIRTFWNGPEYDSTYRFRVYALTVSGTPFVYGPFENAGPVQFESAVYATDDLSSTSDVTGTQDIDLESERGIVIRWELEEGDFDIRDIKDTHVYFQLEGEETIQYVGRTASGEASYLEWNANAANLLAEHRDGPSFYTKYKFYVYFLTSSGTPSHHGPFPMSDFVEIVESN